MIIAIDFDGTFNQAAGAFREIIGIFNKHGHDCIMVTNRQPSQLIDIDHYGVTIPIVYAAGQPKRKAAVEAGYEVHIWIDDMPVMVEEGEPGTWRLENARS